VAAAVGYGGRVCECDSGLLKRSCRHRVTVFPPVPAASDRVSD